VVTSGGRLDASDVTATDLGTSDDGPRPRPAVQFNAGSTGTVVRSTFTRNSVGLQLDGSQDVRIEDVAVTESLGHGLATSRDSGTVLRGIRAERNGGNGIRLNTTTTKEPITGVSTAGNGRFGIAAIRLRDTRIEDMRANGDAAGGLELSQSPVSPSADSPPPTNRPGCTSHIGTTNITLERLAVTGGRRGVVLEKNHPQPRPAGVEARQREADGRRRRRLRGGTARRGRDRLAGPVSGSSEARRASPSRDFGCTAARTGWSRRPAHARWC
jgi:hypothetical protein